MNIYPLYSSSSGNLFCLELDDNKNILIDVGVSYKLIKEALNSINKSIDDIKAILITHEHSDHIKGLPILIKNNPSIPVYTCKKTAEYIEKQLKKTGISININRTSYDKTFNIEGLDNLNITPFEISHDAVEPCGYSIQFENKNLCFATDLGFVSKKNMEYFKKADFIVIESNYDSSMLAYGSYPYNIKERIAGSLGHLSNNDTASTITSLVREGKSNFLIAHMSENNNMLDVAKQTIFCTLENNNIICDTINIDFASKELSCEGYSIC